MIELSGSPTGIGRRRFLGRAVGGAVAGFAAQGGFRLAEARPVPPQKPANPAAALNELIAGNERFAADRLTSIEDDLKILREDTLEKQEPFAAVLACADSRVPVELVFDQTIGHLFVTRVAGNIVTPEIIASLEYGVAVLGVKVLVVLGHSNCGAVKAAMKAEAAPGQISTLYPPLRRAVEQSGGSFEQAITANAKLQAELLRTSSTVIREAVKTEKLKVHAGVYDLASGKVTLN
jgi:carbonic anhydrase